MKLFTYFIASTLLVSSLVFAESTPYPAQVINNFTESCEKSSGGQIDFCKCTINELPNYISIDDFTKIETEYKQTGVMPEKFTAALSKVMQTCGKK